MELTNRLLRIVYHTDRNRLLASDVVGRVHWLTPQLQLERSSPVTPFRNPIYAVTHANGYVVTRDWIGNLVRWDLESLAPLDAIEGVRLRNEADLTPNEEPSPGVARALAVWNGSLYFNNGYVQTVAVDLESFHVRSIRPSVSGNVFLEWICTDAPGIQALSDKAGKLYLGSLDDLDFPVQVTLDDGSNLHRVRYDARFDRFWVTQDSGEGELKDVSNGVVIIDREGQVETRLLFARDDVEFLEFSADGATVYSGGFDGVVNVFDNSEREPRLKKLLGPFSHQLSDAALGRDGQLFLLSQDGNVVSLSTAGKRQAAAPFARQCVWDIQPSRDDDRLLFCATDDGVAVVRADDEAGLDSVALTEVERHPLDFGFVRRVVALPDGGYAGISRGQLVFRSTGDGYMKWRHTEEGLPATLSVSPDGERLLVATDEGGTELDATTGKPNARFSFDGMPMWASAYLPTGEPVLATRNGHVLVLDANGSVKHSVDTGGYPKRMWPSDSALYVIGEKGLKELDLQTLSVRRRWFGEVLNNTRENALIVDGVVHMVSYGQQLGSYDYETGEMIGLLEDFEELPKGMAYVRSSRGTVFLLVGSRGGSIRSLRVENGVPRPVRTMLLRPR